MPLFKILSAEKKLHLFLAKELGQSYHEKDLEDWIEANPEIIVGDEPLLIVGRQVNTPVGVIDLLALDSNGSGVVIELKRAPSQRDAVSQSIEYASWLAGLPQQDLNRTAQEYLSRSGEPVSLSEVWQATFGSEFRSGPINQLQRIFIIIEGEHDRITSMVRYLRTTGLDISLVSYNFYRTETGEELLHLESKVGEDESTTDDEARPSEARLISDWTHSATEAYSVFKRELTNEGLYAKPKKSGMSFSVTTTEGSVFVCFFNASDNEISIWVRNDSMKALIDFEQASETIKEKAPSNSQITHKPVWFIIRLPATAVNGTEVARLVIEEIVNRLRKRE